MSLVKERANIWDKALYRLLSQSPYHLFRSQRFLKVIAHEKPDLIHAHFGPNGVAMHHLLTNAQLDIPLLISLHGTDILLIPEQDPYYKKCLGHLSHATHRMFTVNSDFLKQKAIDCGIQVENIEKLRNCFNSAFGKYRKSQYFSSSNTLKIISIARLVKWKGHEYLIRAFAKLVHHSEGKALLTIVGEGTEQAYLENLVRELHIQSYVNFMGAVHHTEMPGLLQQQDIYVQPSIKDLDTHQEETFGIAILEAIAVGLPVVVTHTGGIPEVVGEPDGQFCFQVPPQDEQAIYEAFRFMVSETYSFKDNSAYFEQLNEKFSSERHINQLVKIYQKLKNENIFYL